MEGAHAEGSGGQGWGSSLALLLQRHSGEPRGQAAARVPGWYPPAQKSFGLWGLYAI